MSSLTREQWQEPGYEIGRWTNSPPVDPTALLYTVNHYPAVDTLSPTDPVGWFRRQQRIYVHDPNRGYSLGYSWGYWPDGTEFEIRGWDYRNAANNVEGRPGAENDIDENRASLSFFVVVTGRGDLGRPATPAQVAAVQHRIRLIHERLGRPLINIVHGDLEPTQCAGAGVNRQTRLGLFLPPDQPDPEDDDMKPVITTWQGESDPIMVAYDPGSCTYLWRGAPDADAMVAAGIAVRGAAKLTQAQKEHPSFRRIG